MSPSITDLLKIGEEVTDAEEESFLLFTQDIPTGNLGFIDSRAATVDVSIRDNEYTIHQSPTLLSSSRAGGTTGAGNPVENHTPLRRLDLKSQNPLWTTSFLTQDSIVTELGCGISALIPLTISPSIQHYIATDQEYVRRYFRTNLDENANITKSKGKSKTSTGTKNKSKKQGSTKGASASASAVSNLTPNSNITFTTLDWELDQPALLKQCIQESENDEDKGFDLLLSCDCIYNDALITPLVSTCADICRLRPVYTSSGEAECQGLKPTVCIVAQQQRAPEVFETWLRETLREFRVWRISDEVLGDGLKGGTGYLVHLLLVREK
ncbi:hypothetical protein N7493_002052 [Penicillium malachiteum]|uniref:Diaminohydroxyphosphoribosylamino-pyrimidine deaminase n=1 Tax=Penicillium malachiteum TaxID=1324776 RepID=A0AAD6HVY8_9EURO|nr:hypothetical protein N7493_002052 [Penicillium malachiteum]